MTLVRAEQTSKLVRKDHTSWKKCEFQCQVVVQMKVKSGEREFFVKKYLFGVQHKASGRQNYNVIVF